MVIKINYTSSDVYVSTSVSPVYVVVNYSAVNNGSGVAWGAITGTLSNQTDLQNALDAKVPYTGATTNVNLGEFELKAGQMTLDITPTGTAAVGTTRWNDTLGSSETTLKGGSVILKNGVDLVARVVNKVTPNTTLTKAAYQAVRVSGAQGQRLAVELAQANNDANSADTIGLVTETINANQEGFIMTVGQLENINTTGSLQGETWVDGDVLYLSPTTAGAITKVKPTGNGHIVVIGYVEYAHVNNGKIFVKVMNGWELDELHDVAIVSPANNEALIYESATSLWKNKTIASALGYTPISGTGASGQVAYWNGTSSQTGSNNLFWDAANNRLGINTATPTTALQVVGTAYITENLRFDGQLRDNRDNGIIQQSLSSVITNRILTIGNATYLNINFPNGNILVGTTTDTGQRLQVQGDAFIKGSGATSATSALLIQNSSSVEILKVRNDKTLQINSTDTYNGSILAGANVSGRVALFGSFEITTSGGTGWSGQGIEVAGANRTLKIIGSTNLNSPDYAKVQFSNSNVPNTRTSGVSIDVEIQGVSFTPTSGTATYTTLLLNQTINQTGGANGITRGLYVNPTLTAAADWRSIEWSNNSGWGLYGAGTAPNFLGGNTTISRNQNATTSLTVSNTTAGASSYTELILQQDASAGLGAVGKMSSISNPAGIITSSNTYLYNGTAGDIAIYNAFATGKIKFSAGAVTTPQMTLTAAGRLLLGTTTESTFLLDVNGTARVSGASRFNDALTNSIGGFVHSSSSTTNDAFYTLLSGAVRFIVNANGYCKSTSNIVSDANGGTSLNASAISQIDSTTKGFLPPRMTTSQKTSIASPAAGLVVYDTDTNKLCCYNGTSWNDLF